MPITSPFGRVESDMLCTEPEENIPDEAKEVCASCEGRGWNIYNTSPDGDKDACHECSGRGFFIK